jgi:hypothetical protein
VVSIHPVEIAKNVAARYSRHQMSATRPWQGQDKANKRQRSLHREREHISKRQIFISENLSALFAANRSCATIVSLTSLRKECRMPMQSHLAELHRRHDALDHEIAKEWAHPGADEARLAELKRRKLQLKDEIAKLMKTECHVETLH